MNKIPLRFQWTNVVKQFEIVFSNAFCSDKKAHFDNLPEGMKTIDGAKTTWCNVILLDAMIYLLRNKEFNRSTRRAFSQHLILFECILSELKATHPLVHTEITEEKKVGQLIRCYDTNKVGMSEQFAQQQIDKYEIVLGEVESPWDAIGNLRESILNVAPCSKAKNKYINIVHLLTNHEAIDSSMSTLIEMIIYKVLFVFVIPVYARSNIKASRLAVKKFLQDSGIKQQQQQLSIDTTGSTLHTLVTTDEGTDGEAESEIGTGSRDDASDGDRFDSPGPSSTSLAANKRFRGDSMFDETFLMSGQGQAVEGTKTSTPSTTRRIIDTYTIYCKPDVSLKERNAILSTQLESDATHGGSWLTLPALEFNDSLWTGARRDDLTLKRKRDYSESSSENGSALSDITTGTSHDLNSNEEVVMTKSEVNYMQELEQHCNLLMYFCNNGGGEKSL